MVSIGYRGNNPKPNWRTKRILPWQEELQLHPPVKVTTSNHALGHHGDVGLRMDNGSCGQPDQVLDNALNNFWRPEQPMAISETTSLPLSFVVSDAVKRWFEDTYRDAQRGDVKQQALLGQMYNEGYGCTKDPTAAAEWIERARRRGYKMDGVYCKL